MDFMLTVYDLRRPGPRSLAGKASATGEGWRDILSLGSCPVRASRTGRQTRRHNSIAAVYSALVS